LVLILPDLPEGDLGSAEEQPNSNTVEGYTENRVVNDHPVFLL